MWKYPRVGVMSACDSMDGMIQADPKQSIAGNDAPIAPHLQSIADRMGCVLETCHHSAAAHFENAEHTGSPPHR